MNLNEIDYCNHNTLNRKQLPAENYGDRPVYYICADCKTAIYSIFQTFLEVRPNEKSISERIRENESQ